MEIVIIIFIVLALIGFIAYQVRSGKATNYYQNGITPKERTKERASVFGWIIKAFIYTFIIFLCGMVHPVGFVLSTFFFSAVFISELAVELVNAIKEK